MVNQRNVIVELKKYFESLGLVVNIGKTKARGNKGFFLNRGKENYRIDISSGLDESGVLPTLLHEFAHYIHYEKDSSLTSLDFIFTNLSQKQSDELINVTIENIPKQMAKPLFDLKKDLENEIQKRVTVLQEMYPNFKKSSACSVIENKIKYPAKYLLKYDNVKVLFKVYSVNDLKEDFPLLRNDFVAYIELKSLQRRLRKVNSRISKLNKYYNQPCELWAHFFELYFTNNEKAVSIAPNLSKIMEDTILSNKIPQITKVSKIINYS